jgi:flagellar biosynthesis chaperone FliJ
VPQFRYRLQTLLDEKVQAKEQAQHALAAAQRELRAEEEELEACVREQEGAVEKLRRARVESISPIAGGMTGEWMRLRRDHVGRLYDEWRDAAKATRAQEVSVNEAGDRLAAARDTLASRSRDVEVLEKHRARLKRRFNQEIERKEALGQEEMANVIFLRGSAR